MARKLPGSFERLATSIRWRVMIDGTVHRFTFPTEDMERAEDLALDKLASLRKQIRRRAASTTASSPDLLTFSGLVARYRADALPVLAEGTRKSYGPVLDAAEEYIVDELRDPLAQDVSTGTVSAYLAWRRTRPRGRFAKRARPLDPKTILKHRKILSAVFDFAKAIGAVDVNPVHDVPSPKTDAREPIILSGDDYESLLDACTDPMARLFVLVLGETGGRCESEVLWLRWEDVDLERSRMEIRSGKAHRTKGGKSRRVPLAPRLREALRSHFAAYRFKGSPWVFHHVRRNAYAQPGERIRSLRRAFEGAAKRAGLPADLRQHDMRHRRVTKWLAEGANPVHVQRAMGHANLATTMGYSHLVDEHVDALLDHEGGRGKSVANPAASA